MAKENKGKNAGKGADKGPTPEEKKAAMRDAALVNLGNKDLLNIGSAFLINQGYKGADGKQKDYGTAVFDAVDEYSFRPSLYQSETGMAIIEQSMVGSREDGRWLTGKVDEKGVSQYALKMANIGGVTVADAVKLIGYEGKIPEGIGNKYMSDLFNGSEEEKAFAGQIAGMYNMNLADNTVSEATAARAKARAGNLEKIFNPEKKEAGAKK